MSDWLVSGFFFSAGTVAFLILLAVVLTVLWVTGNLLTAIPSREDLSRIQFKGNVWVVGSVLFVVISLLFVILIS